jgi:hypothetical protein
MEEPGNQCTVVFALIVTEPASECVCVWREAGAAKPPPLPHTLAGSLTIYAKTTVDCYPDSSTYVATAYQLNDQQCPCPDVSPPKSGMLNQLSRSSVSAMTLREWPNEFSIAGTKSDDDFIPKSS